MNEATFICLTCRDGGWLFHTDRADSLGHPIATAYRCPDCPEHSAHERPDFPLVGFVNDGSRLKLRQDSRTIWIYRDGRCAIVQHATGNVTRYSASARLSEQAAQMLRSAKRCGPSSADYWFA